MLVISNKVLIAFSAAYQDAELPLQVWRKLIETGFFKSFAELKLCFNSVDKVGSFYIFDIGGNKYRLIAAIHFNRQMLFIRHVLAHKEYDQWKP
jgi:mRNA interferase HigB